MSTHMDKALVAKTDIIKAELVEELQPLQVNATLQIVIPTPNEAMHMLYKEILNMNNTLSSHTDCLVQLQEKISKLDDLPSLYDLKNMIEKRIHERTVSIAFMKTEEMCYSPKVHIIPEQLMQDLSDGM